MSELQRVGPVFGGSGTAVPFTSSLSGAQRVSDAHGRYMTAILENRCFKLQGASLGGTAYVGAGGGTPLLAIHNPANSNKVLALLAIAVAERVTATAAGTTTIAAWSGVSVQPTGTQTNPTNAYSLAQGGSAALGFINTALTGSTALVMALPVFTYYWATAAAAAIAPGFFDVGGLVVAAPGNQIAVGATVIPTSTTWDIAMYWEEVPLLVST